MTVRSAASRPPAALVVMIHDLWGREKVHSPQIPPRTPLPHANSALPGSFQNPTAQHTMTDTTKAPKPPAHLTAETCRFWEGLVSEYALEPHHLRTLEAACQSWDRYRQAVEILRKEGLTFSDRLGNVRARPEVKIEVDARTAYLRAMRELGLDHVANPEAPRPPARA